MKLKKLIAPIVISCITIICFLAWGIGWCFVPLPTWGKLVGFLVPIALIGVVIWMLIERIKEIRSGEEDDLSKY